MRLRKFANLLSNLANLRANLIANLIANLLNKFRKKSRNIDKTLAVEVMINTYKLLANTYIYRGRLYVL